MDIGVPSESLAHEHRVALTPGGVTALVAQGHRVFIQSGAGSAAGHSDDDYRIAGGVVAYARSEVFGRAELLLGVQAPHRDEYALFHPDQAVLAFWGLPAAHADDLRQLAGQQVTAIGLEVVEDDAGRAPALMAMSEIAGSLAVVVGAGLLLNEFGGKGILLTGAPGVPPANTVILGTGVQLSIGGGIGQSRTLMLLLKKAHLGEVSVTVWPKVLKEICARKNIVVLE